MHFRIFSILYCLLSLSVLTVYGQNSTVNSFFIRSETNKDKIPFVHLVINDSIHAFSDMNGKFELSAKAQKIKLIHPFYNKKELAVTENLPDTIFLSRNNQPTKFSTSDDFAVTQVKEVLRKKKYLKINSRKYTYKSYNKFTVDTKKKGYTKQIYDMILEYLSYDFEELGAQHLFLMESVSEMSHRDRVRKKEKIIGMRSTGIKLPSTYTNFVHPHPLSVYDNYVKIASSKYVSPLCNSSYYTYAYQLVDSAIVDNTPIYVIKYYPFPAKSIDAAQGLIYINGKENAVQYFVGSPAKEAKVKVEACQEYAKRDNVWFPSSYRTDIIVYRLGVSKVQLNLSAHSYIFNFQPGVRLKPRDFSEIILEYDSTSAKMPDHLWKKYRQEALTAKDQKTFHFFDSTGVQKRQEEFLKFGERIYFGEIPIGKVNLNLNKIVSLNYLEGLRLGLGFHTNQKFSENLRLGAYFGHGFKDNRWKYGADVAYRFNDTMDVVLGLGYRNDVYEAGAQFFPFDITQYSTEPLRKYRLSVLDYNQTVISSVGFRPLKYLQINAGVSFAQHTPSYNYSYKEENNDNFKFAEITGGFRYAFGEEYIKTPAKMIYLGTEFPVLWFNYTRGLKNSLWGDYSYQKFDFKIQQTFKFFRFGTSGIQLIGGITTGNPPYPKLYNMMGSLRNFSVVIHNSFETMQYNEFLSDRFFAVFYSHDFGQLYSPNPNFRPNIVMVHNFGIGTLSNLDIHKNFDFKIMNKGYFESGIFLKNLLVINLGGLRTGLGLGLFARYGNYEYKKFADNFVLKLAANFFI